MKKVRIGIIGCGNISRYGNGPGYLLCERAQISAVCDAVEGKAKECKKILGARKFYTDYHGLLKDKEVDAVDICLPHHLHAEVAVEAAEHGKHISVQKPMAMTPSECETMIKAARKAGIILMVEECEIFYSARARRTPERASVLETNSALENKFVIGNESLRYIAF